METSIKLISLRQVLLSNQESGFKESTCGFADLLAPKLSNRIGKHNFLDRGWFRLLCFIDITMDISIQRIHMKMAVLIQCTGRMTLSCHSA